MPVQNQAHMCATIQRWGIRGRLPGRAAHVIPSGEPMYRLAACSHCHSSTGGRPCASCTSRRAYHRVLKLARTIADLAGVTDTVSAHLAEAIQYRPRWVE